MEQRIYIEALGLRVFGSAAVMAAGRFAAEAHAAIGQVRKYTGEPYIHHPAAVAAILQRWAVEGEGGSPEDALLAAAWLHDTVEDTNVTIEEIYRQFGGVVGALVGWVTDVSKPADGNRAVRKQIDLEHLANAPAPAQTIKLADLIDNTKSIVRYDPVFARVYLREKDALLGVLTKGSPALWQRARALCDEGLAAIN